MDQLDTIPHEKMLEIVDDFIGMKIEAVTFSGGGEPLLYKPLPDIIERLAAGGIKVATLTNGVNLKGRMADALARFAIWARVSIDAWDDESYVKSRGARVGEFGAVINNMRAFAARGSGCVLGISFIVGKDNWNHIYDVCRIFKDIGVSHVKLSPSIVSNSAAENRSYHDPHFAATRTEIDRALALQDSSFAVIDHFHEMDEQFAKPYSTCPFLPMLTVIGADLNVYTCQDKAYTSDGLLGSIKGQSFRQFWFSDENRKRILSLDPSTKCRHHCVAHDKNLLIHEVLAIDPAHGAFV